MLVAVALLTALGCVVASARRLWLAARPTALHLEEALAFVGRSVDRARLDRLRAVAASLEGADWERELLAALAEPRDHARVALVNEQLTELDLRLQRWARVPRVCASLSTSVALLLGTLVLRSALADAPDLSGELGELFVRDVIGEAIAVVSIGLAGTTFCIAAHAQSLRLAKARGDVADALVERLEAAARGEAASAGVRAAEPSS